MGWLRDLLMQDQAQSSVLPGNGPAYFSQLRRHFAGRQTQGLLLSLVLPTKGRISRRDSGMEGRLGPPAPWGPVALLPMGMGEATLGRGAQGLACGPRRWGLQAARARLFPAESLPPPYRLQQVSVQLVDNALCDQLYSNSLWHLYDRKIIQDDMLCAGSEGRDSCYVSAPRPPNPRPCWPHCSFAPPFAGRLRWPPGLQGERGLAVGGSGELGQQLCPVWLPWGLCPRPDLRTLDQAANPDGSVTPCGLRGQPGAALPLPTPAAPSWSFTSSSGLHSLNTPGPGGRGRKMPGKGGGEGLGPREHLAGPCLSE